MLINIFSQAYSNSLKRNLFHQYRRQEQKKIIMRIKKRKNNNGFFKYLGFICEISRFITGAPKIIPQVLLLRGTE